MVAHGVSQAAAVREHATKLEEMAICIIDAAETPAEAAAVLAHKDGKMSVLDLALKFELKRFLTNPNCRAIMDKWWSGGDSGGGGGGDGGGVSAAAEVGSLRLLMHAVLPFTNPYYIAMAREAVASRLGRRSPIESGPKLHSGLTSEASSILNRASRIGRSERGIARSQAMIRLTCRPALAGTMTCTRNVSPWWKAAISPNLEGGSRWACRTFWRSKGYLRSPSGVTTLGVR